MSATDETVTAIGGSSPTRSSSRSVVGAVALTALALTVIAVVWWRPQAVAGDEAVQTLRGEFVVDYRIQVNPNTTEGGEIKATSIQFFREYIVAHAADGSGIVLYNDRTTKLSWRRK